MRTYLLSLSAAAVLYTVAKSLLNEKSAIGKIASNIIGVFMIISIILPLKHISFDGILEYFDSISESADTYIDEGTAYTSERIYTRIKSDTEAYILDKAKKLGLDIAVEVDLVERDYWMPYGVTITGNVSPYAKEVMETYLEDTLGIAKENQRWK